MTQPIGPMSRLDLVSRLTGEFGQPLEIIGWWREAFRALDDPSIHELILWLMRQSGKSQCLMAMGVSEILTVQNAFVLFVSASDLQAQSIYSRKLRRPLERLLRALGAKRGVVRFTKRGVEVPGLGSTLEIVAPNEATAPARSPTLLILDEARDIPDRVYAVLVPSVIGAGGKTAIGSTAGAPRGFFYELTRNPTPETWLYHSTVNENPHANPRTLAFIRRRLSLFPAAVRRELDNEFAEDGNELLPSSLIEVAVDDDLGELLEHPGQALVFEDLSRKQDLTSRVVVVREAPCRPEAADHLVAASIRVWDPRQSPTGEVDFAEVRADLASLPDRFPGLTRILVDEGAEAGAILPWARAHPHLSLLVEGFVATPDSNMKLWSSLAARLHARTLSIPRHERLLAELRNLRQEAFAFGSKWRVVDASRKFHRDVSLALAGACYAADLVGMQPEISTEPTEEELAAVEHLFRHPGQVYVPADEVGGNLFDEMDAALLEPWQ